MFSTELRFWILSRTLEISIQLMRAFQDGWVQVKMKSQENGPMDASSKQLLKYVPFKLTLKQVTTLRLEGAGQSF
jgi:hypothetical protein